MKKRPGVELAGRAGRSRRCRRSRGAGSRRRSLSFGARGGCARRPGSPAARRSAAARSGTSCSRLPPSGAPLSLKRPIVSPGRRAGCGPRSRSACGSAARRGTCRRASTLLLARRPPTRSVQRGRLVDLDVVRAVLEAHAGCAACRLGGRRRGARRSRAAASAARPRRGRCRGRLRTAWKATCGSSAHACTQRSPPLRAGSSWSPGKRAERPQRRPACRAQAEAVLAVLLEQLGPEADRDRQPRRRQAERLAGVLRRRAAARGRRRRPACRASSRAAATSRSRSRSRSSRAVVSARSNAPNDEPRLRGRRDAGLARPVERDDRRARRPVDRVARAERKAAGAAADPSAPPPAAEQVAAGERGRHGCSSCDRHRRELTATSGSASAAIACANARRSACVSSA